MLEINTKCHRYAACLKSRILTNLYDNFIGKAGVTANQFGMLIDFENNKGYCVSRLADIMMLDRTTIRRNLKPLLTHGLVEFNQVEIFPGKIDKRKKIVIVTEKGLEVIKKCIPLWEKAQKEAINMIEALDDLTKERLCLKPDN